MFHCIYCVYREDVIPITHIVSCHPNHPTIFVDMPNYNGNCPLCSQKIKKSWILRHVRQCVLNPECKKHIPCGECDIFFRTRLSLKIHKCIVHGVGCKQVCVKCFRVYIYKSKWDVRYHKRNCSTRDRKI